MKLVLENKQIFYGVNFGNDEEVIGEVVFNSSMVGYQDIIADPCYQNKIIIMNYPLIGNYGVADEDYDYKNIHVKGLIVSNYNDEPSNFRSTSTLADVMIENKITGISELDTRELVEIIRENGALKGAIVNDETNDEEVYEKLEKFEIENNTIDEVSTKKVWYSKTSNPKFNVVIIDAGVKTGFVKSLKTLGYNIAVVPFNYPYDKIMKLKPNGIIISNGPSNPNNEEISHLIENFKDKLPILGLGFGALSLALSYKSEIEKLNYGLYASNTPVRNIKTRKIMSLVTNNRYEIQKLSSELIKTHEFLDKKTASFVSQNEMNIGLLYEPLSVDLLDKNEDIFKTFSKKMEESLCQKEKI